MSFRSLAAFSNQIFDVIICADNAIPHLLTNDEILRALQRFFDKLRVGGLAMFSVRDYAKEDVKNDQIRPYKVQMKDDNRIMMYQGLRMTKTIIKQIFLSPF